MIDHPRTRMGKMDLRTKKRSIIPHGDTEIFKGLVSRWNGLTPCERSKMRREMKNTIQQGLHKNHKAESEE